jgi:hypothetical protein
MHLSPIQRAREALLHRPRPFSKRHCSSPTAMIASQCICMHRKRINVSTVLAGQRVGIKDVDEGIWIVSFMQYDLGYIDLEQKTLQPLDNPFDARLSPLS